MGQVKFVEVLSSLLFLDLALISSESLDIYT